MKSLILIFCFFIPSILFSQHNIEDNEVYCDQYRLIIKYIKQDSTFKSYFPKSEIRILIDSVTFGIVHPFTTRFYLAQKFNVDVDEVNLNDTTFLQEYKRIEEKEFNLNNTIFSECLSNLSSQKKRNDVWFQFFRRDCHTVTVIAKPLRKYVSKRIFGIIYLFIFENDIMVNPYTGVLVE